MQTKINYLALCWFSGEVQANESDTSEALQRDGAVHIEWTGIKADLETEQPLIYCIVDDDGVDIEVIHSPHAVKRLTYAVQEITRDLTLNECMEFVADLIESMRDKHCKQRDRSANLFTKELIEQMIGKDQDKVFLRAALDNHDIDTVLSSFDNDDIADYLRGCGYFVSQNSDLDAKMAFEDIEDAYDTTRVGGDMYKAETLERIARIASKEGWQKVYDAIDHLDFMSTNYEDHAKQS